MTFKLLFLTPLILAPSLLLTGAWYRQPHATPDSAGAAASAFQRQELPLKSPHFAVGASATQILDAALGQLNPARTTWLKTQVWQKMDDSELTFEAKGTLDLGPDACARLDLQVRRPGWSGRLLTISDGRALAVVQTSPGEEPVIEAALVPEQGEAARRQFLREKGCGGPLFPLQELRTALRETRIETGRLAGRSVIRLRGEIDAGSIDQSLRLGIPARYAAIFLDADTLWPLRIEWWGHDRRGRLRAVVEMEFRAPVVNRPLSVEECTRLFSYRPEVVN